MAEERPKRQRTVRSCTEFFGAGLLHKEEVELRRALNASLKEARNVQQKKREKSAEPVIETRSICTNTDTKIRIKASRDTSKSEKSSRKEHSHKKKKRENKKEESELSWKSDQVTIKSQNKTDGAYESSKVKNKGSSSKEVEKCLQRKELQSPIKSHKATKPCKGKELKILFQSKTAKKQLNSKKVKGNKKSRVVQSLTEKFSGAGNAEKHTPMSCGKRKKESVGQSLDETCSDPVKKKKKIPLQKTEDAQAKQISCTAVGETQSTTSSSVCELKQVPNVLQGKLRRKIKHKLKDRKLVSPLGEIYIPANIAKTEDFLTFLCLRGSSSLPRSFEVFNNPDPFFTHPTHHFADEGAFSCPVLPIQSSVTYSPPSSNAPSESSAASPMSSTDGWLINDD
ncbi:hypothetical protein ACROYT_G011801 [Oculina patagonica]